MSGNAAVDLRELAPVEMARLLGKPEGAAGTALGAELNRANAGVTEAVYQRLQLKERDRVLEVGFANGRLLPALLAYVDELTYVGLDIAETMVTEARTFNTHLVASGRAAFHLASVAAIPCPDDSFDKAFAINVSYFWPDPVRALSEMRRVLRPGGICIVAAVTPETAAGSLFAREEFGFRTYDEKRLVALHREAGFREVVVEHYDESITRADGTPWERHYSIVTARH
jgi:ubiquinone/menaquinone biosynthesis C-methylase UbiE